MERKPARAYINRRIRRTLAARTFDTVLDVGCGEMRAADWVHCRRYVGVDLDRERLDRGVAGGGNREAVLSRLEDMPADLQGDLVLCLQMIGFNVHAPVEMSLAYVERLIAATRPGGMLIVNVGTASAVHAPAIEAALTAAFARTDAIRYGRFLSPAWRPVAPLLVALMERWPRLAATPSRNARLFIAEGRR